MKTLVQLVREAVLAIPLHDVQDIVGSPGRLPEAERERIRVSFAAHAARAAQDAVQSAQAVPVGLSNDPKAIEAARRSWTGREWDEHPTPEKDQAQYADHLRAQEALVAAVQAYSSETFEQAWARMEAEGYQYGRAEQAQVRLGWNLAKQEPTFEEAWARTGYRYGEDALEQVRFGWELAKGDGVR